MIFGVEDENEEGSDYDELDDNTGNLDSERS